MPLQFLVGTRKGLFVVDKLGTDWRVASAHFLGVQVPMVATDVANELWVAGLKHGHFGSKVHRSEDHGSNWEEVTTPTYPEKPADEPDIIDPIRNQVVPWSLELIWSLEISPTGRIWCGTIPGGLFFCDDGGHSWELVTSLWERPERRAWFGGGFDFPGIHSICLDPSDENKITIGVSCGGVWVSEDRGHTWDVRTQGMFAAYMPPDRAEDPSIQDPHLVAQCRVDPATLWVQHHNGIFVTRDYCQTWREVEIATPSSFGFAVASHPQDPDTAWFVPAISDEVRYPQDGHFVVTRTRNGGQDVEIIRDGLPQQDAYHLVFRHALAVDAEGQTLAMGSTTGGLWISENAGDSWKLVTQDLPPIYCVKTTNN